MRLLKNAPAVLLTLFALTILTAAGAPAWAPTAAAADITAADLLEKGGYSLASEGDIGEYPALAHGADGSLHVSYYGETTGQLHYAYLTEYGWAHRKLPSLEIIPREGKFSSLAIDSAGQSHITFWDENSRELKYTSVKPPGDFAPPQTVASGAGESQTAMAIDKNDNMTVAFFDETSGSLKVAFKPAGGAWTVQTADGSFGSVGWDPALALDQDGYPHIAYYDFSNKYLKYVAKDANGWQAPQVVDQQGDVGGRPSLALNNLGQPFITYFDWSKGDLKFAYHDAEWGWQSSTLHGDGYAGETSSLVLDENGRPHVVYYHAGHGLLYKYRLSSGAWSPPYLLDGSSGTGVDPSLVVGGSGSFYVVYYDGGDHDLQFIFLRHVHDGLTGNVNCEWGERTCNPCVADVEGSFNRLNPNGDILGFHTTGFPDAYTSGNWFSNHWQGAQRLMGAGGKAFVVTLDHDRQASGTKAVFNTVWMGTRAEGGERWRSNRLLFNEDFHDTAPSPSDAVYDSVTLPSEGSHPGGIQAMGEFLAVGAGDQFFIYDMHNPWEPSQSGGEFDRGDKSSSTSAIAQLQDGNYVLAISDSNASSIDFYRTNNEKWNPVDPDPAAMVLVDEWKPDELQFAEGNARYFFYGWDTFQNINFVTECGSGELYLIATSNLDKTSSTGSKVANWGRIGAGWVSELFGGPSIPHPADGEDWASLFHVRLQDDKSVVTKVAERHFSCGYRDETYCNFDAAAGVYVDDNHQLYLYSTEHRNDGPQKTVKAMEFRPEPHGSCGDPQDGWLELFEGEYFKGRSLMIDWLDRDKENYQNYDKVEDYEDKAASATWCLPHDWSVVLYEDKEPCGGRAITLRGTGAFRKVKLSLFGDDSDTSCSRFVFDPPRVEIYKPALGVTIVYIIPDSAAQRDEVSAPLSGEEDPAITITIPPGALPRELTFTLTPVSPPSHLTGRSGFAGSGFTLTAAENGTPLSTLTFDKPAAVTIGYDRDQLLGLEAASLDLHYWNDQTGQWTPASLTCPAQTVAGSEYADGVLTAKICKSGEYALLANKLQRTVLVDEMHDNLLSLSWTRAQRSQKPSAMRRTRTGFISKRCVTSWRLTSR